MYVWGAGKEVHGDELQKPKFGVHFGTQDPLWLMGSSQIDTSITSYLVCQASWQGEEGNKLAKAYILYEKSIKQFYFLTY